MKKKIQKPFDVEAAKKGAVIETKGGRPVRIVCYDRKDDYPIIALVDFGTFEDYNTYSIKGEYLHGNPNTEDLVIVEEVEVTKFNVGDWIFRDSPGASPLLIVAITSDCYMLQDSQGHERKISQIAIDRFYRFWTIADSIPGDVLVASDGSIFISAGVIDSACKYYVALTVYNNVVINEEGKDGPWEILKVVHPASKRQCDLLFKKLKEKGYKWEAVTYTLWKKCN